MGVLTSKLFTSGDPAAAAKLEACATGVPNEISTHFAENGPGGEAVRKLQIALSHVAQANTSLGIPPFNIDGVYSKPFGDAVERYKSRRSIFNFAGRIDRIVGIKTIRALDKEEAALNDVIPDFPIPPIDPFHTLTLRLSGDCLLIGERGDDFGADDLKFGDGFGSVRRASMKAACAAMLQSPDSVLETQLRSMMVAAMGATAAQSGETPTPGVLGEGMACVEHFISAGGTNKIWDLGNPVSDAAKTNNGLRGDLLANAEIVINTEIRRAWDSGTIDDRVIASKLKASHRMDGKGIKMSGALTAFIGGVHAYTLKLCKLDVDEFSSSFSYALDVELIDHFGLDEDDVADSSGGLLTGGSLMPFFMLQHFSASGPVNHALHRYRPYRTILRTRIGPTVFRRRP